MQGPQQQVGGQGVMPTAPMREPLVRPAAAGPAGLTSRQAVWQRMLRALRFDASVYTELERDPTGTRQAARVVAVVAAAAALGTVLLEGWRPGAILGAVVAALLHWLLWGGLESLLGRALFRRQTPLAHHLRALGYAQTPQLLALLAFVPTVGAWAVLGSRLLTMLAGN